RSFSPHHVGGQVTSIATLDRPVTSSMRSIDRFLFEPVNARTAAIMRMALAVMLPWSFWSIGLKIMPPAEWIPGATRFYNQLLLTRGYAAAIIFVAMLFGAGIRPRMTGIALFVLLLPLDSLSRGRQSRQVLLFALLAFSMLRSDACWSVQRWLKRDQPVDADAGPMWPIRLIQIQLSLVYAVNAFAKATSHYTNGDTLIGMSRMRPNFLIDMSDGFAHFGPIALPVALAATGSVIVESYLAVGFWFRRLRWITAAVGVMFHIMLQSIVHIFMLDLASMFLYLAFLLPWSKAPASKRTIPAL
ncbi:MAG TPA: HTTM domain-containing protein, partial [Tepidisphaeraceae bacterium]|nr:HTTM domain-containing protein [Tepidisphaeraceae bacterium]